MEVIGPEIPAFLNSGRVYLTMGVSMGVITYSLKSMPRNPQTPVAEESTLQIQTNNLHICLASRGRKSKWEAIGMAQEKCTCLWETAHGLQQEQDKNLKYWLSLMLHQAALCHAVSHLT